MPNLADKRTECPLCRGAGFVYPAVLISDPAFGKVTLCPCRLKEWVVKSSGLPQPAKLLADLKPRRQAKGLQSAIHGAQLILEQKMFILTLMGEVGLAKSHILQGIGWEWVEKGKVCHYTKVARLLDLLQATYDVTPVEIRSAEETPFQRKLNYYCKVPLLLLDDMGVEKMTEWRQEKLDIIVDYRYENKLPLVVSTNIPFSQMSHRISDRLQDKQIGRFIALSGPSYRTATDES